MPTLDKTSFLDRLTPSPAPPPQPEQDPLPKPTDRYKPFSRRSNDDEHAIHFISPAGTIRSLQYQHLDDGFFSSECIVLNFMGIEPKQVKIHGRSFTQEQYEQVLDRRTRWARQASDDFAGDGETIVTLVTIEPLKEEGEEARAAEPEELEEREA